MLLVNINSLENSDTLIGYLSRIIPHLTDLSKFIFKTISNLKMKTISFLFQVAKNEPKFLLNLLQSFNNENILRFFKQNRRSNELDEFDDEWDEEVHNSEYRDSSLILISILSEFASYKFLSRLLGEQSRNLELQDSNDNHFSTSMKTIFLLGNLMCTINEKEPAVFSMINYLAFSFCTAPRMWYAIVHSNYIENFDISNLKGFYIYIYIFIYF